MACCLSVSCDTLDVVVGGNISMTTDGSSTVAMVTCEEGFTRSGTGNLTCRSDGTWDVQLPTCGTVLLYNS